MEPLTSSPERLLGGDRDLDGDRMTDLRPNIRILCQWMMGNWHNASLFEVLGLPFRGLISGRPKTKIDRVEDAGKHLVIRLKNVERPLYYPKNLDMENLYAVIDECMDPRSWHSYEFMGTAIAKDDIILDCGASEGLFSLLALERCRRIFIAEPLLEFVESLNLTFGGIQKAKVLPYALSKENGEAYLAPAGIRSRLVTGEKGVKIGTRTIDSLFIDSGEDITYMKADVEGHELDLLAGGAMTIQKNTPKIAITTYHDSAHAELIAKFLTKIEPHYIIRTRGIMPENGSPIMLHAWIGER